MKQLGHLITHKMELTVLSPVFIGGGTPFKGIKSEEEFRTKVLKNNPEMNKKWIDYFLNFKEYKSNKDKRIPYDAKAPSLQGFFRFIGEGENTKNTDFIKIDGEYKIPGSSIKGAIRTALLSDLIKKNQGDMKISENEIREQMKHISITDSEPLVNEDFWTMGIIPQKIIDNYSKGYSSRRFEDKRKFLTEGVKTHFLITIDTQRSKYTLNDILRILKEHYSEVIKENEKALNPTNVKLYDSEYGEANINIGGQSGFNTKVVLRSIARDENEYIKMKKEELAHNFRSHNHNNPSIPTAPRYLKFVKEEFEDAPPCNFTIGWCNISEVK